MPPTYVFGFGWPPAAMEAPSPVSHRSFSFSFSFSTLFFFCFLFVLLLSDHCAIANLQEDASALLAFKANLTNAKTLSSWQNQNGVCVSWVGVTCGSDDQNRTRIVELRLPGRSLYGSILAGTLGKLKALRVLSLHHNRLQNIPSDLANCVVLREIHLFNNVLSGPLPANFSVWPLLRYVDLSFNNLNGSIPPSLNNLTQLRSLRLQENDFSGSIPNLSDIAVKLKNFSVAGNNLSGPIPSYLARFGEESFTGNSELCGNPLQTPCVNSPSPSPYPAPSPSPPVSRTSPSPAPSPPSTRNLTTGAIAATVVGSVAGAALFLVLCLLLWVKRRSRKNKMLRSDPYAGGRDKFESRYMANANINKTAIYKPGTVEIAAISNNPKNAYGNDDGDDKTSNGRRALNKLTFIGDDGKPNYDLEDLLRASAEVLGKGSLGTAYKASMSDGLTLVVKRLREIGRDMDDEASCKSTMEAVGSLRHPNLVPVRAFFFTKKEKLIISDYMPQGSLFALLHGNNKGPMEWAARLAIASGAAKGLVFLHSKKVVHGSIKSMNVHLDKEGVARWSDYGLLQKLIRAKAEIGGGAASDTSPNGYTPPEVVSNGKMITYKGDVYSFGVLLLELITGKSPTKLFVEEGGVRLPEWVESCGREVESVDPWIREKLAYHNDNDNDNKNDDVLYDEVLGLLRIALPCVSPSPDKRPHMVEIVKHIQDLIGNHGNV